MSAHTIPEQLRELAGARQLAVAVVTRPGVAPELRQQARRLLADIRTQRRHLHAELIASIRAGGAP